MCTALRQAESIRLRLAAVAERDPSLDLLLKAVAVMGGSVSLKAMTPVWSALKAADGAEGGRGGAEPVTEVIQRGIELKLLKHLAASGAHGGGGGGGTGARRKSSAASTEGAWAFHHLRIQDTVDQVLLNAEARALHRVCAESLEGLVLTSQLAQHHQRAGQHWQAAQQFAKSATEMRELGCTSPEVAELRRALTCLEQCDADDVAAQRLELQTVAALMTTWTLGKDETELLFARFDVLRKGPAKDAVGVDQSALMLFAGFAGIWTSYDYFSLETPNSHAKLGDAARGDAARWALRAAEVLQSQAPSPSWGLLTILHMVYFPRSSAITAQQRQAVCSTEVFSAVFESYGQDFAASRALLTSLMGLDCVAAIGGGSIALDFSGDLAAAERMQAVQARGLRVASILMPASAQEVPSISAARSNWLPRKFYGPHKSNRVYRY